MLRSTGLVVPILLSKMQKDPSEVNEVKLSLLQRLQPNFHFKHADLLVHILETVKNDAFKPEGSIIQLSNPLMWFVLITDILKNMSDQFRSLDLRINFVRE